MPTDEMKARIADLHSRLIFKVHHILTSAQLRRLHMIDVTFNDRLRTTIGRASSRENWIELNPRLLAIHPDQFETTVAHELAHIVAPMIFGRKGHGHQIGWKRVMKLFGQAPERTHRLEVGHLLRRHPVVAHALCGCEGYKHPLKSRVYNKIVHRGRIYKCMKCNERLKLG